MKLYSENNNYKLYQGSMLDMLEFIKFNSIDSIVTDPPYELNFMNKGWDNSGIAFSKETWEKCYEVLKPGGYLLAFGGSRTYHRIACAIEDAGFEIRDCIMWLYGSGFPKSMNIGLAIDKKNGIDNRTGKIIKGMCNNNTLSMKNGTSKSQEFSKEYEERIAQNEWQGWGTCLKPAYEPIIVARKPFKGSLVDNVIENGVGALNIDKCKTDNNRFPANIIHNGLQEEWSRYFYCAKASKKDRDEGLDEFEKKQTTDGNIRSNSETARKFGANSALRKNIHPTVKPTELMQYLVRLVSPNNATILDPFMGSGSTGKAVMYENLEKNKNYKFIGIELTEEYLPIADARIRFFSNKIKKESQTTIFDFINEV